MEKVPIPKPKRGISRHLTEKQRKFAELLVSQAGKMTGTECAIEAGYPKDTARVKASQLQSPKYFPVVYNYIAELREEARKKYDISMDGHLAELAKIRDQALVRRSFSSAVNAEVARGKVGGLYVDQKKILSFTRQRLTTVLALEIILQTMVVMLMYKGILLHYGQIT